MVGEGAVDRKGVSMEPSMGAVYRLCGIVEPEWHVSGNTKDNVNVGRDREPSGATVALRWIKLLDGRPFTRRSDRAYDAYESGGSTLRVKVG